MICFIITAEYQPKNFFFRLLHNLAKIIFYLWPHLSTQSCSVIYIQYNNLLYQNCYNNFNITYVEY